MKKSKSTGLLTGVLLAAALTIIPSSVAWGASQTFLNTTVNTGTYHHSVAATVYEAKANAQHLPGCGWGGNAYIQILENSTKGSITGPTTGAFNCNVTTTGAGSPLSNTRGRCWWTLGGTSASGLLSCNAWYY